MQQYKGKEGVIEMHPTTQHVSLLYYSHHLRHVSMPSRAIPGISGDLRTNVKIFL